MSESPMDDAEICRGFANRCHELESQLGDLIKSHQEKKLAGKKAKQEKNLKDVYQLINSLQQKLTRSKLSRLSKALPNLTLCEQQLGVMEGEVVFTRDVKLITESIRDLSNFLEAELSQGGERMRKGGVKVTKSPGDADEQPGPSGFLKQEKQVKEGETSGKTEEAVQVDGKPDEGKSADNKGKPQDEKSTDKKEKLQDEKSTKNKEKSQGGESTEQKGKCGSGQENKGKKDKGASGQLEDMQDDIMKAMQGKVGELGDQFGGQVKQLGDRVFQGLVQKFKP